MRTVTPFPVEYARLSTKRGGAPTVVPHCSGSSVKAEVLVLSDTVQLREARNLLWRREIGCEGSGREYRENRRPNAVLVRNKPGFCDLDHVLYANFNPEGKIPTPDPHSLACKAISSVAEARPGQDGISYLMSLICFGIQTPLTQRYVDEILAQTGTSNLAEALEFSRSKEK